VLAELNAKTLELRKSRDPLAGALLSVQSAATANAKERAVKAKQDLSTVKADDEDALRAIQKGIKQVQDTLSHKPDHADSLRELEILEGLLPQMASEDEIRGEAESFIATLPERNMKQMGGVMAHLAATFGTSLDKGKASGVVKALLSA
jgi:uncharacterized protein YqeY